MGKDYDSLSWTTWMSISQESFERNQTSIFGPLQYLMNHVFKSKKPFVKLI